MYPQYLTTPHYEKQPLPFPLCVQIEGHSTDIVYFDPVERSRLCVVSGGAIRQKETAAAWYGNAV